MDAGKSFASQIDMSIHGAIYRLSDWRQGFGLEAWKVQFGPVHDLDVFV